MDQHVLVTPKSYLSLFARKEDRNYFYAPVPVDPICSGIADKLLYVRDLNNGNAFPVDPKNVKLLHNLTKRQKKMMGVIL